MELTRIEKENASCFEALLPPGWAPDDRAALGLVEDGGYPVAAALVSGGRGTISLDWIFVFPKVRGKGVGSELVFQIMDLFREEARYMTVHYLDLFPGVEALLRNTGFLLTEGDTVYTIPLQEAGKSPLAKKIRKEMLTAEIIPVSKLSEPQKGAFLEFLEKETGTTDFYLTCDPDRSFTAVDRLGISHSCLLTEQAGPEMTFLSLLLNRGPAMQAEHLVGYLLDLLSETDDTEGTLRFVAANESVERLMDQMMSDISGIERTELRRAVCIL